MKKKQFLKLVMSYGIQRDKAARMAARVGKFGSYEALFLSLRPSLAFWQMGARMSLMSFAMPSYCTTSCWGSTSPRNCGAK